MTTKIDDFIKKVKSTAEEDFFTQRTFYHLSSSMFHEMCELLKEQEPLEPTRVEIYQAGPLYHRCYCKKCGHHVGNMIKNKVTEAHENFCSKCGQAVKWE